MATQLFAVSALATTLPDGGPSGATNLALSTTRGSSAATMHVATTTNGNNIALPNVFWYKVGAGSISGNVTANIRGKENATGNNAGAGIKIEHFASNGTTLKTTLLSTRDVPSTITEYTTTDAAKALASVAITTGTAVNGDLIKVTIYADKVGIMGADSTGVTVSYNGPSGAAGDTSVTFATTLPVYVSPYPQIVGTDTGAALPTVTGGYQAGDLILHWEYNEPSGQGSGSADFGTITAPSGYTMDNVAFPVDANDSHLTTGNDSRMSMSYRWCDGTETATTDIHFTNNGEYTEWNGVIVIRGAVDIFGGHSARPYQEFDTASSEQVGGTTFPATSLTTVDDASLLIFSGVDWNSANGSLAGWTQTGRNAGTATTLYQTQATAGATGSIAPADTNSVLAAALISIRGVPSASPYVAAVGTAGVTVSATSGTAPGVPAGAKAGDLVVLVFEPFWLNSTVQPSTANIGLPSGFAWGTDSAAATTFFPFQPVTEAGWSAVGFAYKWLTAADTGSYTSTYNITGLTGSSATTGWSVAYLIRGHQLKGSGSPFASDAMQTAAQHTGVTTTFSSFAIQAPGPALLLAGILGDGPAPEVSAPTGWLVDESLGSYSQPNTYHANGQSGTTGSLAFTLKAGNANGGGAIVVIGPPPIVGNAAITFSASAIAAAPAAPSAAFTISMSGSPTYPLPIFDTFTGTNGDPWAGWWKPGPNQKATVNIQGNAGAMTGGGSGITQMYTGNAVKTSDIEISFDFQYSNASNQEWIEVGWRNNGSFGGNIPGTGTTLAWPTVGYDLEFATSGGAIFLYKFDGAGGGAVLINSQAFSFPISNTAVHVDITHIGNVINIYIWTTGGKPGTPTATYTDSTSPITAPGWVSVAIQNGGGNADTISWDNFSITTPTAAATATASFTITASATASSGSIAATGTAAITFSASSSIAASSAATAAFAISSTGTSGGAVGAIGAVTFSATATPGARATATAAVTVSATGNTAAPITGTTAAFTVAGTATPSAPIAGSTAAFSVSASGLASGAPNATAAITFSATSTAKSAATATAVFTISSTATSTVPVSATASFSFSATATAAYTITSATATFVFTATGTAASSTVATATFVLTGGATARAPGAATAAFAVSATAIAAYLITSATAAITFSATGAAATAATTTATITFSATATTSSPATATAAIVFSATSASGVPDTGTASFTISATNSTLSAGATGTATFVFSATATVKAPVTGTATLTVLAASSTAAPVTATATFTFSATAIAAYGILTGVTAAFVLSATGAAATPETATATFSISATANSAGTVTATATFVFSATGAAKGAATSTATFVFSATTTAPSSSATATATFVFAVTATSSSGDTATATFVISATGTASSPFGAAAAFMISTTGTAAGIAPATGIATFVFSATAIAAYLVTSATAAITFAVTAAAGVRATATGIITFSATAITAAPETATATFVFSATGTARSPVTGTAAIVFSATTTVNASATATGVFTISATTAAAGTQPATGIATFSVTATAIAAGRVAATGAISISALAGVPTASATATGTFVVSATTAARVVASAAAAVSISATATASYVAIVTGTAAITIVASGNTRIPDTAVASFVISANFHASGSGASPNAIIHFQMYSGISPLTLKGLLTIGTPTDDFAPLDLGTIVQVSPFVFGTTTTQFVITLGTVEDDNPGYSFGTPVKYDLVKIGTATQPAPFVAGAARDVGESTSFGTPSTTSG